MVRHHWFGWWIDAFRQYSITRTNVDQISWCCMGWSEANELKPNTVGHATLHDIALIIKPVSYHFVKPHQLVGSLGTTKCHWQYYFWVVCDDFAGDILYQNTNFSKGRLITSHCDISSTALFYVWFPIDGWMFTFDFICVMTSNKT